MRDRISAALVGRSTPTVKAAFGAVNNRGPGFDTIRLVAASAVVLHHSLSLHMDIVRDDWIYRLSGGYIHLGLLAVAVFFSLSGFLVTPGLARSGLVIEFVSRRFMRIMPLLTVVVAAVALLVGPALSTLPLADYFSRPATWRYFQNVTTFLSLELPGVRNHSGGTGINGPMWTLQYEWICYLALAAASLTGMLRRRRLFLVAWLGSIAALWLLRGDVVTDGDAGRLGNLLFLFQYFAAGVLVFLYADTLRWSKRLMVAAFAALLATWFAGLGFLFGPALTAYLVVGAGLMRLPWTSLLSRADLSYGVYLTHSVVLTILMYLHPFKAWWALFGLALPLSMGAAFLTWTFIESPALRRKDLPAKLVRRVLGSSGLAGSSARPADS